MANQISAIQSGDQTVVIVDGEHYRKGGPDADYVYNLARKAQTNPSDENIEELISALDPHARAIAEDLLERDEEGNYTLPGFRTPVPDSMAEHILDLYERDIPIDPFQEFWKQAMMNPNSKAREDIFEYCQEYGITITQDGYMILYKAVNNNPSAQMSEDLIEKIGVEYLRIKRKGEAPANYSIVEDTTNVYHMVRTDVKNDLNTVRKLPEVEFEDPHEADFSDVIRLAKEYDIINFGSTIVEIPSTPNEDVRTVNRDKLEDREVYYKVYEQIREVVRIWLNKVYVDHGSLSNLYDKAQTSSDGQFEPSNIAKREDGKYGMSINLGEPVPMPREECDPNINKSCSKGLHVGSYDYVSDWGSSRDTILACIVSPRDIVALPKLDKSKLRTCLYTPYAIMERDDDGNWEEIEETQVDFEYMDEKSDMDRILRDLEDENKLSDAQKDRKKIIENRLEEIN